MSYADHAQTLVSELDDLVLHTHLTDSTVLFLSGTCKLFTCSHVHDGTGSPLKNQSGEEIFAPTISSHLLP